VERLALIGVSHRRGGTQAIEAWQRHFAGADPAALGLSDWVIMSTCNRWDVVTTLPETLPVDALRAQLTPAGVQTRPYAFVGEAALEQLTRIAASLDSLNPGEDQIMRQVREAFVQAQQRQQVGTEAAFAFHTALKIARRVRREVALAPVNTSLFSLARPELERYLPHGGTVAVVGAGEMGTQAVKTLAALPQFQVLVVNRSAERAWLLAQHTGVRCAPFAAFLAGQLGTLHALVCATPVEHLVTAGITQQYPELRCIIDLGLPRNVHPEVTRNIKTLNVDTLQQAGAARRSDMQDKLADAERIIHSELQAAIGEWTEKQLGTAIRQLRERYLATISGSLPADEAAKLAHKFAHIPIKGLRAVAREYGPEAAKLFLTAADLGDV
jgi:glutamyl-tRNA reductase